MSINAIRGLVHRYADGICRGDQAQISSCWAEDARWVLPHSDASGIDAILSLWRQLTDPTAQVAQIVANGDAFERDGVWEGRWYVTEILAWDEAPTQMLLAYYDDTYAAAGSDFVFAERRMTWLYRGPIADPGGFLGNDPEHRR